MNSRKEISSVNKDGNIHQNFRLAPGGNGRVYGISVVKSSCPLGKYWFLCSHSDR